MSIPRWRKTARQHAGHVRQPAGLAERRHFRGDEENLQPAVGGDGHDLLGCHHGLRRRDAGWRSRLGWRRLRNALGHGLGNGSRRLGGLTAGGTATDFQLGATGRVVFGALGARRAATTRRSGSRCPGRCCLVLQRMPGTSRPPVPSSVRRKAGRSGSRVH